MKRALMTKENRAVAFQALHNRAIRENRVRELWQCVGVVQLAMLTSTWWDAEYMADYACRRSTRLYNQMNEEGTEL